MENKSSWKIHYQLLTQIIIFVTHRGQPDSSFWSRKFFLSCILSYHSARLLLHIYCGILFVCCMPIMPKFNIQPHHVRNIVVVWSCNGSGNVVRWTSRISTKSSFLCKFYFDIIDDCSFIKYNWLHERRWILGRLPNLLRFAHVFPDHGCNNDRRKIFARWTSSNSERILGT